MRLQWKGRTISIQTLDSAVFSFLKPPASKPRYSTSGKWKESTWPLAVINLPKVFIHRKRCKTVSFWSRVKAVSQSVKKNIPQQISKIHEANGSRCWRSSVQRKKNNDRRNSQLLLNNPKQIEGKQAFQAGLSRINTVRLHSFKEGNKKVFEPSPENSGYLIVLDDSLLMMLHIMIQ